MSSSLGVQIAARLLRRGSAQLPSTTTARHGSLGAHDLSRANLSNRQRRCYTTTLPHCQQAAAARPDVEADNSQPQASSSNPAMQFPCLDAQEAKTTSLLNRRTVQTSTPSSTSGPEPSYTTGTHQSFHSATPLALDWGGILPSYTLAYETWGTLDATHSNAILLHTGLSASSHAHSTPDNPKAGWWEKFIGEGPSFPIDTSRYFVICTNVLGGCYGSTGPSSVDPSDGGRYATRFPILTMDDMVRAQTRLLDHLGIEKLYASVGASMGGMQSLAFAVHFPQRVGRVVSISGCARSHPYSIAMRHTQRQVLMMDPKWNRGFYYDGVPPHSGMKLAREIATVTYRSGPEWEKRFGRRRADDSKVPALCPDFLIETYLDYAGEKFSLEYDANSLLYVSKAMDLFDLGAKHQTRTEERRSKAEARAKAKGGRAADEAERCGLMLPDKKYEEKAGSAPGSEEVEGPPADLVEGLTPMKEIPTLVMGVASDILFPAWQQREIAETLRAAGNQQVTHVELGEDISLFGHDTFLLDLKHIGGNLGKFLA